MTVRVQDPGGQQWSVRRGVVRGKDARGWRWKWRGPDPDWLEALRLGELGELADVPVLGPIVMVIVVPIFVVLLVVFLPFLALGLLEALILGLLALALIAASTLFGRPILVRAERTFDRETHSMLVWAVKGWGPSKRVRDAVVDALRTGFDPTMAVGGDGTLIADRRL